MKKLILLMVAVVGVQSWAASVAGALTGTDSWGGIEPLPAVVNSRTSKASSDTLSLRGEWEFVAQTQPVPARNGVWDSFALRKNWPADKMRKIRVPGNWEAQGVGAAGDGECWDCKWDHNAKPVRHKYMGEGWYRREVEIPAAWAGKRIWFKAGGMKAQGWVWVNDEQVAWIDNYCGTYKYDITDFVKPGAKAKIVIAVDNRLPSRKGLLSAMHRWGGVYRDVELEATPPTRIDDAWVRGDFDTMTVEGHVTVRGADAGACKVRMTVAGKSVDVPVRADGETVARLAAPGLAPWHTETPNLHWAEFALIDKTGAVTHTWRERFGIRKLEVRGKQFFLNNKPFFFRGFGDDHVYPLTGMTVPDRAAHLAHLKKARAAGFNFVRLHTHCEVPEYFEAADELGILIQPELPYYSDVPTEAFQFDPIRDITELWTHYRRYPSFGVYSCGNEGGFGKRLGERIYKLTKGRDPDRLMIGQDGERVNFDYNSDYGHGPFKIWSRGSHNPERPFITHEYLNLGIKLDTSLEPQYTGVWQPPQTVAQRNAWLDRFGLSPEWGDALQRAQHGLQRHWQKAGVECARADPYCDGLCFWTIVDVVVNAGGGVYSGQGLFDPFWGTKRGGFTPEEFAAFNAPTVVLLDTDPADRVATAGDTIRLAFRISHFGAETIPAGAVTWRVLDARGTAAHGAIEPGAAREIATVVCTVPEVAKPTAAQIEVEVGGVKNSWPLWIFPKRATRDGRGIACAPEWLAAVSKLYSGVVSTDAPEAKDARLVIAPHGSAAAADALKAGKRVITLHGADGKPNVELGWWWMGSQVGTALKKDHPVFGALPHEGYLSQLLFRVVKDTALKLPDAGCAAKDLMMVGEGGDACYLYLAEAQTERGRHLAAFGLDVLSGHPEATALLDGMVEYMVK